MNAASWVAIFAALFAAFMGLGVAMVAQRQTRDGN